VAKQCAYCRKPLGFFSGTPLLCANTEESVCSACYDLLLPYEPVRRAKALLEHGAPSDPDSLRRQIELAEQDQKEKMDSILTDATCVRCGVQLISLGRRKFQMGESSFFGGDFSHLIEGALETELLVCPRCRRLEYVLPADSEFLVGLGTADRTISNPAVPGQSAPPPPPAAVSAPASTPPKGSKPPWER